MADQLTLPIHKENCNTVFLRSVYDKDCPRCSQINKVIQLRRRTYVNGATPNEIKNAAKLADQLIAKYGLSKAECVDRLYVSASNKLRRHKKNNSPKPVAVSDEPIEINSINMDI